MKKKDIIKELGQAQINEPMGDDQYWSIIDESIQNTHSQVEQKKFLINKLTNLTLKEIIGFDIKTSDFKYELYTPELWCASTIINDTGSDDLFEYFRAWVISMGKEVFEDAKKNPDSLISVVDLNDTIHDFEEFSYIPNDAFKKKTRQDIYDFEGPWDNFHSPDMEFNWNLDEPITMYRICPKLFSTYFFKKFDFPILF